MGPDQLRHDLGNKIMAIIGSAAIARGTALTPQAVTALLDVIEREAQAAMDIVDAYVGGLEQEHADHTESKVA